MLSFNSKFNFPPSLNLKAQMGRKRNTISWLTHQQPTAVYLCIIDRFFFKTVFNNLIQHKEGDKPVFQVVVLNSPFCGKHKSNTDSEKLN